MTAAEASMLYQVEKEKRAGAVAVAIEEARVRLAEQLAAAKDAKANRRPKPKLVIPKTDAQRRDIREAQLDSLTYDRFAR